MKLNSPPATFVFLCVISSSFSIQSLQELYLQKINKQLPKQKQPELKFAPSQCYKGVFQTSRNMSPKLRSGLTLSDLDIFEHPTKFKGAVRV